MRPTVLVLLLSICIHCIVSVQIGHAQFGGMLDRLNDRMRETEQRMKEMRDRSDAAREQMEQAMRGLPSSMPNPRGPIGQQTPRGPQAMNEAPMSQPWNREAQQATDGMRVTPGPLTLSNGERWRVRDETGSSVVAKHHVTIGSTRIGLMPDGSLKPFADAEISPTQNAFEPLDMDALEAKLLADPKLDGFEAIRSRRFLYLSNTSDRFIKSARTILESMYPAVRKYFSRSAVEINDPELPMVVIAFATEQEFQAYRPMPRGVVAYYDTITNAVYLYEQSELSKHAPEIAVKNAISTIAHEGAHQILHNIGVQQRLSRWPLWLSEGLAEFFAPTSVNRGIRWSGLGATNELRMFEIDQDWATTRRMTTPETIEGLVASSELGSLEYAYSWALIHMMSKRHRSELYACIRDCSQMQPFEGTSLVESGPYDPSSIFRRHITANDAETAEELTKHLRSLKYVNPVANQTHFVIVSGTRVYMTSSPERVRELRSTIAGRFQIQEFPNRALAERAMAAITQ